jgi:ATP-dependent DNA helicase PIF1
LQFDCGNRSYCGCHGRDDIKHGWWEDPKEQNPMNLRAEVVGEVDDPNEEQTLFYERVTLHYGYWLRRRTSGSTPRQILDHLDGRAGTGKTHAILMVCRSLEQQARNWYGESALNTVIWAAPSGIIAHAITGRTLHALFKLPIHYPRDYQPMSSAIRTATQALFKGVKYLIVDEKSMMGFTMLAWIHMRCCEIFPHSSSQPFGGLNIIITGDFYQLPPVLATPLFSTQPPKSVFDAEGQRLYKCFDKTIVLLKLMRQAGTGEAPFCQALEELRNGKVSMATWILLSTRVRANLSQTERAQFDGAVQLVPTRQEFREKNHERLRDRKMPVLISVATHEGSGAVKVKDDVAGNLMVNLPWSLGARYMFTENLWVEADIANGPSAALKDIFWYVVNDLHIYFKHITDYVA